MVGLFLCPDWGKQVKLPQNTIRSDFKAYLTQNKILKDDDAYYAFSIQGGGNTAIAKTTIQSYYDGVKKGFAIYVGAYDETNKSWTVYQLTQNLLHELSGGKAERPNFNKGSIENWVKEKMVLLM